METTIILICLLFSAFFSGMEIAFLSVNRLKVELSQKRGSLDGKLIFNFLKKPSNFIVTCLIGNNVTVVCLSIMVAKLLDPIQTQYHLSEFWGVISETIISTILLLVIAEFIPKVLFRIFADSILPVLVYPFYLIFLSLRLVVIFVNSISGLLLKMFGVKLEDSESQYSVVDLEKFIKEHSPEKDETETVDTEMFENALYLENIRVKECMVPRKEIVGIDINDPLSKMVDIVIETNHSRIIIFEDHIDNIKGYAHHFDLLQSPTTLASIVIPIMVVPEIMTLQLLLNKLIKENKSIAWVVDEYGGTAGIITLEDILEEIFGEINDEYDDDDLIENQLSQNEFILSGRLEVDQLNEHYKLNIPEGEYETLSGFIISESANIPQNGEIIEIGNFIFKVLDVSDTKIETVKLTIQKKEIEEN